MAKYLVYDKIDELLRERGMSRRQLAKQAGITTSNMSALFMRKPVPLKEKYIRAIAEALDVDLSTFDNDRLEQEYKTREMEAEAKLLNDSVGQMVTRRMSLAFKQVNFDMVNNALDNERLADIILQIDVLDEADVRAIEEWLTARRIYKSPLTVRKAEDESRENSGEQESKV